MEISFKNLKKLPVITKSGSYLGKISEIEFDTQTHSVSRYLVKMFLKIRKPGVKLLVIKPSQVLDLNDQRMVVEDNLVKVQEVDLVASQSVS